MHKVTIDMDQAWIWFFRSEPSPDRQPVESATVELPDAFVSEYNRVSEKFFEMQRHLEHCYRHQAKLSPLTGSPFVKEKENENE